MAVNNGRHGLLALAGVGSFPVGVQAAPAKSGALWQVAMLEAVGRRLRPGAMVQLDGAQLRVVQVGNSPISRGLMVALLGVEA